MLAVLDETHQDFIPLVERAASPPQKKTFPKKGTILKVMTQSLLAWHSKCAVDSDILKYFKYFKNI